MYQAAHYELRLLHEQLKSVMKSIPTSNCMIAMCPIYPATCNFKDVLMAMKGAKALLFCRCPCFRSHPEHILKYWKRKGIKVDFTEQDQEDLLAERLITSALRLYVLLPLIPTGKNNPTLTMWKPRTWLRILMFRLQNGTGRLTQKVCAMLNWFTDHYHLPLFIVENGFGAIDKAEADGMVR